MPKLDPGSKPASRRTARRMGNPTKEVPIVRRSMALSARLYQLSKQPKVKIGTAIKITRTKKGTKTVIRGGSAQQRKNEREQARNRN